MNEAIDIIHNDEIDALKEILNIFHSNDIILQGFLFTNYTIMVFYCGSSLELSGKKLFFI